MNKMYRTHFVPCRKGIRDAVLLMFLLILILIIPDISFIICELTTFVFWPQRNKLPFLFMMKNYLGTIQKSWKYASPWD